MFRNNIWHSFLFTSIKLFSFPLMSLSTDTGIFVLKKYLLTAYSVMLGTAVIFNLLSCYRPF